CRNEITSAHILVPTKLRDDIVRRNLSIFELASMCFGIMIGCEVVIRPPSSVDLCLFLVADVVKQFTLRRPGDRLPLPRLQAHLFRSTRRSRDRFWVT